MEMKSDGSMLWSQASPQVAHEFLLPRSCDQLVNRNPVLIDHAAEALMPPISAN
jgi:hypothetical protein